MGFPFAPQKLIRAKKEEWGLIDGRGNTVVDFVYDDTLWIEDHGFGRVIRDGLMGVIAEDGSFVVPPRWESVSIKRIALQHTTLTDFRKFILRRADASTESWVKELWDGFLDSLGARRGAKEINEIRRVDGRLIWSSAALPYPTLSWLQITGGGLALVLMVLLGKRKPKARKAA